MKFLIINSDYPVFLKWLYTEHSGLAQNSYEEQLRVRNESLFGVADFYSSNLKRLGYEAHDVHVNNDALQNAWATEHGINGSGEPPTVSEMLRFLRPITSSWPLKYVKPMLRPLLVRLNPLPRRALHIVASQIQHYRPDVLLNQAMDDIQDDFLSEMKPNVRLVVGQIAAPLVREKSFRSYDLVISSLPNFVERFRRQGIDSELHRLAFEPAILDRLDYVSPIIELSFVGSLSFDHRARVNLLETLSPSVALEIWGQGSALDDSKSPLFRCYRGTAWGLEMYRLFRRSKMTLNHHIGIAENYANNARLFEATGVGTMLLTDWKQNLRDIFEPGKEIVAYNSPEECLQLVRYYLEHDAEREQIALAGQKRTLRDHTYATRMPELIDILRKYV